MVAGDSRCSLDEGGRPVVEVDHTEIGDDPVHHPYTGQPSSSRGRRSGRPEWALSLNGVQTRFSATRRPQLGEALLRVAHDLTKRVR
ncbi:hypothetical protein L5G28_00525 [Gordonia sp. HY285]|uniref:hypothetical protein n=1 Tax=Gordonia liuliyuniae TaxID=2911517 RepID=UPI001F42B5B9|nr:hypothetical protein [Gordonia liuliyuniae]MCF8608652.1 hypothetical protein [Gordonia liuliyuniae]